MVKREIKHKKRYLASFLIGTLVFLLVIGLSYAVALFQYSRVSDVQSSTAYSLFEQKSSFTFFGDDICLEDNFDEVSRSLDHQGRIMEDLEKKFGRNNDKVLERKKFYSVLLLEHLDYVNLYNERCSPERNVIIFFYSNVGDNEPSERAGRTLNSVRSQNDRTLTYSFDANLDSFIVERLKEKYNITSVPAIIVNDEYKMEWPFSVDDIVNLLN